MQTGQRGAVARVVVSQNGGLPGRAAVALSRAQGMDTLSPPGIARITGSASGFDDEEVGVCEVYGAPGTAMTGGVSLAPDEARTQIDVQYETIADEYPYGPLQAAELTLELSGTLSLSGHGGAGPGEVAVDSVTRSATVENGKAIIIDGSVDNPDNLSPDHLGGYEVRTPVQVYVSFDSE